MKLSLSLRPGHKKLLRVLVAVVAVSLLGVSVATPGGSNVPNMSTFNNDSGVARTYSSEGTIDLKNPFLASLGTNQRSCVDCHQPGEGWTIAPAQVRARFDRTDGLDPLFRTNDGSDCPSADVSTVGRRRQAYSMLLSKGLIRVSLPVPGNANFAIREIEDPHQCSDTTIAGLALFRRPLPAANLRFLTTVMWDGRESFDGQSLDFNLTHQAVDATLGHAQALESPDPETVAQMVSFEMSMFNAQSSDTAARDLGAQGGKGGPLPLAREEFYVGINDPLGGNPTGEPFDPVAFTLFERWRGLNGPPGSKEAARGAIARGETLFNTLPIRISGVTGLNDLPGMPSVLDGTCTTCHDTPNVGNHSVPLAINIGISDYPALPALDTTGLPVYTVQCDAGVDRPIGASRTFRTTDPARALITGRCVDVGKTKGPVLRGLAARPPYFHNGSATTLEDVVAFYDQRFAIGMTPQQKADLAAFLKAL